MMCGQRTIPVRVSLTRVSLCVTSCLRWINRSINYLSASDMTAELKLLKPNLDAFFEWCGSLTAHGKLGKAINYALNQKELMMNVLLVSFFYYIPHFSTQEMQ